MCCLFLTADLGSFSCEELKNLENQGIDYKGRILISDRAHVLFDFHQAIDGAAEDAAALTGQKIGTTRRGIGPAYASKVNRIGVRVADLQFPQVFRDKVERMAAYWKRAYPLEIDVGKICEEYLAYWNTIQPTVVDSVMYLNEAIGKGRRVMVEGANATMLDLDFGTYPYVTSSNCSIGGACTGLGIPPSKIGAVVGVVKVQLPFKLMILRLRFCCLCFRRTQLVLAKVLLRPSFWIRLERLFARSEASLVSRLVALVVAAGWILSSSSTLTQSTTLLASTLPSWMSCLACLKLRSVSDTSTKASVCHRSRLLCTFLPK